MRKISFIMLCFAVVLPSIAQQSLQELLNTYNSRSVPYISVEETRRMQLHDTIILLDSREINEYMVSKIPSAIHVGYDKFDSADIVRQIEDKNTAIVVYCSLGIRSEDVGERLKKVGYTNVKNLYGGIFEWKNKGNKVIDSLSNPTENIHTFSKEWSQWLSSGNKIYPKTKKRKEQHE